MKRKDRANKVWKFIHKEDYMLDASNKYGLQDLIFRRYFNNDWLILSEGFIVVKGSNKNGYAWDGCSPKVEFLDLLIGTPDGRIDYITEKPITYFASMVHDALYQFKGEIDISRKEADQLFARMLRSKGFKLWRLYYWGVRLGGGFYGKWKRRS